MPQAISKVLGDPRRPDEVCDYALFKRPVVDTNESTQSLILMAATLIGLAGLYVKVRLASWVTIFITLSYLSTTSWDELDGKQTCITLMFGIMGVVAGFMYPGQAFQSAELIKKARQAMKESAARSEPQVF